MARALSSFNLDIQAFSEAWASPSSKMSRKALENQNSLVSGIHSQSPSMVAWAARRNRFSLCCAAS
ncbi:MAG: hypothetical protein ACR2RF_14305 [Geminicoccaceae bacterium]